MPEALETSAQRGLPLFNTFNVLSRTAGPARAVSPFLSPELLLPPPVSLLVGSTAGSTAG